MLFNNSFLKEKLTESKRRPKGIIEKATKANKLSSEFLLAYILPMIAFDFGNLKYLALFVIYFTVLAFLCIRNNNIYTNVLLEVKGYRTPFPLFRGVHWVNILFRAYEGCQLN